MYLDEGQGFKRPMLNNFRILYRKCYIGPYIFAETECDAERVILRRFEMSRYQNHINIFCLIIHTNNNDTINYVHKLQCVARTF